MTLYHITVKNIYIFFFAADFSQLKEVSSILLDLIRWDGDKQELRIYSKIGTGWRHFYDDSECVRDVFGKWFKNAIGLPNGSQFPKSWEGLFNLLTESDLGEVAKELHVALIAVQRGNKDSEIIILR